MTRSCAICGRRRGRKGLRVAVRMSAFRREEARGEGLHRYRSDGWHAGPAGRPPARTCVVAWWRVRNRVCGAARLHGGHGARPNARRRMTGVANCRTKRGALVRRKRIERRRSYWVGMPCRSVTQHRVWPLLRFLIKHNSNFSVTMPTNSHRRSFVARATDERAANAGPGDKAQGRRPPTGA